MIDSDGCEETVGLSLGSVDGKADGADEGILEVLGRNEGRVKKGPDG